MDKEKLITALQNTVTEVMGTMAFADVGFEGLEEASQFSLSDEAVGLVALSGEVDGMVAVATTEGLVKEFVSRMVGLPADDLIKEDLIDGVSELANMVCGGMKSKAGIGNIQLAPPVSILGGDFTAALKTDNPIMVLKFQLELGRLHVYATL